MFAQILSILSSSSKEMFGEKKKQVLAITLQNDVRIIDLECAYLFGFVRGRRGAPGFNFALGYWDRYVIIDISSIFGFIISSGLMSCNEE